MTLNEFLEQLPKVRHLSWKLCPSRPHSLLKDAPQLIRGEICGSECCPITAVIYNKIGVGYKCWAAPTMGERHLFLSREDVNSIICAADTNTEPELRSKILEAVGL